MKPRLFFWTLSLIAVLVASACASTAAAVPAATASPVPITQAPTAGSVDVQAVATSRGPNLEATDPTTVSLASGQLQLVEFFRFT